MDWTFFQELLLAKPDDMPKLWDRAISRFRTESDTIATAVPSELNKALIRDSIINDFPPYGTEIDSEDSLIMFVDEKTKGDIGLC